MNFLERFTRNGLVAVISFVAGLIILNALVLFYYKMREGSLKEMIAQHNFVESKVANLKAAAFDIDQALDKSLPANDGLISFEQAYDSVLYNLKRFEYPLTTVEYLEAYIGEALARHKQYMPTESVTESHDTPEVMVVPESDQTDVLDDSLLEDIDSSFTTEFPASIAEETEPAQIIQPLPLTTSNQSIDLPVLGRLCDDLATLVQNFDRGMQTTARDAHATVLKLLLVLQIVTLLGIPFLIFFILEFRKKRDNLRDLTLAINDSNNQYVFNSMEDVDLHNAEAVKASLLENLRRATEFIQRIANGDYSVRWEGMNDKNREQNNANIAGELIKMREQMREVKEQDRIRIWSTEGLSKFGEIIRNNQNNFDALSDNIISNAVKYVEAKVGGLYILEEEEDGDKHLALRACYAFERKKYITKRIEIGEGLVGQTYLEGKTIHLREVPTEYITITSGLGETNPKSLLLIPLRVNERVEGVLELASLKEFQDYEVAFFEKLAETLAASIVSVRTGEKTKVLLAVSQEQSEEMRAQEEEMRQNMEELEATQEQMQRQMTEVNDIKNLMEREKQLFSALMDNIPDAIYFKDLESKFIRVSKYLADHFKSTETDLIGKSDFDFQDDSHAREAFEDEQKIMETRVPKVDFVEKEVTHDGQEHYVSTTKMPLLDAHGSVVGTFGISRDVSKLKRLEIEVVNTEKRLKEEETDFQERIKLLERKIYMKDEEIQELRKGSE